MIYQFRAGVRIPDGVTPEGIMAERDRIEAEYGEATTDNSVDAVLSHPEKYPNLKAFGPKNSKDAIRRATAEGIRTAYRSIVIVRTQGDKPLRAIHRITRKDPETGEVQGVFKTFEAIRQLPADRKELITQLRKEAESFQGKLVTVLSELEELA